MKKLKKMLVIYLFVGVILLTLSTKVFASNIADAIKPVQYSEKFKKYLELPEEEKQKVIQPAATEALDTSLKTRNPFNLVRMIGSNLETRYTLKDVIGSNVNIKNQGQTNSCWAFAALSSLETNLALLGGNKSKVYDFSERHMEYATSRFFANNEINQIGFNRKVGSGGSWGMALAYLTNGTGAIDETQMKFEDNEDLIPLSAIQNKTVTSQVYDTVTFPTYDADDDNTQIIQEIKEHIKGYGSVSAQIYGAQLNTEYYNNDTGAIYCDDADKCPVDHGVSIIGWDDNYDVENFNEKHKPSKKGAWIIENSWGERLEFTLEQMKEEIFNTFKDECIKNGWESASRNTR